MTGEQRGCIVQDLVYIEESSNKKKTKGRVGEG